MTTPDYASLVAAATQARLRAYAPYSHFAVGAVALSSSGLLFPGCNIENAAYPATTCADRIALFNAYAAGERDIVALAIVADTLGPVSPCGTCRQVIFELAPHAVVILANLRGQQRITTPLELLPDGFSSSRLQEAQSSLPLS